MQRAGCGELRRAFKTSAPAEPGCLISTCHLSPSSYGPFSFAPHPCPLALEPAQPLLAQVRSRISTPSSLLSSRSPSRITHTLSLFEADIMCIVRWVLGGPSV